MSPSVEHGDRTKQAPGPVGVVTELERQLASGKATLPMLPRVALQILSMADDSHADATQLQNLLHQDPALAANVLRLANSPAYLPRSPIRALSQAVTRLGFQTLRDIAMTASLQADTFSVPGYENCLAGIWEHSFASAIFAQDAGRLVGRDVECVFLCGLLHEIGRPSALHVIARLPAAQRLALSIDQLEELLERYHVALGTEIARQWKLPPAVAFSIATYTSYEVSPGAPVEPILTSLADALATNLLRPDAMPLSSLLENAVIADLGLTPEAVVDLASHGDEVRKKLASMLL